MDYLNTVGKAELLFHGTRALRFDKFDLCMLGSGEGKHAADGIYFTPSLKGAGWHADYTANQNGIPLIYVCVFKQNAKILTLNKSIDMHPKLIQKHWDTLPVWISTKTGPNWYSELALTPESSAFQGYPKLDDRERCKILFRHGIDAIRDFESGQYVDHIYGRSHLVLNTDSIEIIEILNCDAIADELSDDSKSYFLADDASELGSTGVLSRIRVNITVT